MINLSTPAESFTKGGRSKWHDHEFLNINVIGRMNATIQPNRYALILDKATIKSVLEHAAHCALKPRVCRPLDTYTGKAYNADLQRYDAAVDAAAITETEEELPEEPPHWAAFLFAGSRLPR